MSFPQENSPLVSILITAYNREKYIAQAITSALNSTYTNFEIIVVDDCSADKTFQVAASFGQIDKRVKVFFNEINLGDYKNRNKAASLAAGKYLKYLDADDAIYPYTLSAMVSAMEIHPDAAMGIEQAVANADQPYPILVKPGWVFKTHFLERGILNSGPSGTIIRREIFDKLNGFSGEKYIGDTELWLRIATCHPIVLLPPALAWWRSHDEQQVSLEHKDKTVVITRYKLNKKFILSADSPLNESDRKMAFKKLNRRFLFNSFRELVMKFQFTGAISSIYKSGISFSQALSAIFH